MPLSREGRRLEEEGPPDETSLALEPPPLGFAPPPRCHTSLPVLPCLGVLPSAPAAAAAETERFLCAGDFRIAQQLLSSLCHPCEVAPPILKLQLGPSVYLCHAITELQWPRKGAAVFGIVRCVGRTTILPCWRWKRGVGNSCMSRMRSITVQDDIRH